MTQAMRGCRVGNRSAIKMRAFDQLPREIRDRLNASPINLRADVLLADIRRCRWTVPQALAFVGRLEAEAPALIQTARRTASNELARLPCGQLKR